MVDSTISLRAIPLDVRTPMVNKRALEQQQLQNERQARIDKQNAGLAAQQGQINDLTIQGLEKDLATVDPATLRATLEGTALDVVAIGDVLERGDFDSARIIAEDMIPALEAVNLPTGEVQRFLQIVEQQPDQALPYIQTQIQSLTPYLPELFVDVEGENGQPVAQRNLQTGQLSGVPESMQQPEQWEDVMNAEGVVVGQRNSRTNEFNPVSYPNRPTAKGSDDVLRYVDTGEPVFPDVAARALDPAQNSTLRAYESGIEGVLTALSNTSTGAISGRMPAFTSEQQSAEGAISAMAPILKSIFREAGEGVFTDKDQELLLNMLPKRTDNPEAQYFKARLIDNTVRAKLGLPDDGGQFINQIIANIQNGQQGQAATNTPGQMPNSPARQSLFTNVSDDELLRF